MKRTPLRRATPLRRRAQKQVQKLANEVGGDVTIRTYSREGRKLVEFNAKPKKPRKNRLKIRVKKRDLEWARAVKERDGFQCRLCVSINGGSAKGLIPRDPRGLHACHIFGRAKKATRHDLDNGLTLCMGHHLMFHGSPLSFVTFAQQQLGGDRFNALRRRAMGIEENATVTG